LFIELLIFRILIN